jgi:hypothetical protein
MSMSLCWSFYQPKWADGGTHGNSLCPCAEPSTKQNGRTVALTATAYVLVLSLLYQAKWAEGSTDYSIANFPILSPCQWMRTGELIAIANFLVRCLLPTIPNFHQTVCSGALAAITYFFVLGLLPFRTDASLHCTQHSLSLCRTFAPIKMGAL